MRSIFKWIRLCITERDLLGCLLRPRGFDFLVEIESHDAVSSQQLHDQPGAVHPYKQFSHKISQYASAVGLDLQL